MNRFPAVDPITRVGVYECFERVQRQEGVSTVLVTHDVREAVRLADYLVVLRAGRVLRSGATQAVVDSPGDAHVRRLMETPVVMRWIGRAAACALLFGPASMPAVSGSANDQPHALRIGSKHFNESYLLAEIGAQLLESRGYEVERRFGLGGTLICFDALVNDEIDLYFEYTGTLSQAVLHVDGDAGHPALNRQLRGRGLRLLQPLGFSNSYAMVGPARRGGGAEPADDRRPGAFPPTQGGSQP